MESTAFCGTSPPPFDSTLVSWWDTKEDDYALGAVKSGTDLVYMPPISGTEWAPGSHSLAALQRLDPALAYLIEFSVPADVTFDSNGMVCRGTSAAAKEGFLADMAAKEVDLRTEATPLPLGTLRITQEVFDMRDH